MAKQTVQKVIKVPEVIYQDLDKHARYLHITVSQLTRMLLQDVLADTEHYLLRGSHQHER